MDHFIPGAILLALLAAQQPAQTTSTISGEFVVEPPTLVSLGFEWRITGDRNRNAHVDVNYCGCGESQWRQAQ
jgi:hypothetical protein